ncbi:hypothetical protein EDD86DRAFT_93587 [Gorgonomyces haynaldii]|nr:hypothetical protein EDD86DRAFT_93587 [Gorgonomyces haynaldii]
MFLRVCVGIIVFGLYLKMTRDLLDKRLKRGQKRRMSTFSTILSSDHGSFHSQSQITPTTIFAQAYFESSEFPTRESLIDFCILQLSQHYRFASYVEREQTGSYFVSCRIDPLHHIKSDTLPDEASVPDYIESQFNRTWTQEIRDKRPLWYIHRLETAKGRCCILFEVHHCLGDGLSMMDLFQDIVTNKSGKPVKVNLEKFMKPAKSMAFNEKVLSTGLTSLYASVSVGKVLLQSFIWPDAPSLIHPKEFKTPKAHKMHSLKPMSLAHIKAIKNKHKTTVNDVVASLIAGLQDDSRWTP